MLIIVLATLSVPEFVSAQGRQVTTNYVSGQGRRVTPDNNATRSAPRTVRYPPANAPEQRKNDEVSAQKRSDAPVYYTLEQDSAFAHWSIGGGIGISIFDGDIRESAKRVVPTAILDWTFTANIERSFNPIWGLGLGYAIIPYGANPEGTTYQMRGTANEWDVYLSVNMLNLFYRSRPQKWGIFLNLGMGMSYYNAKMTDRITGEVVIGRDGHPMDLRGGVAWVWPFAALVEYNLCKHFAIGLKGEYRLHDKDNFEGYVTNVRQGTWNDAFELLTLTLRYKPHFGKEYHVRNYSYGDRGMKDINKRLTAMEQMIKDMMDKPDSCCIDNTDRIQQLEEALRRKPDTMVIIAKVPEPVKTMDEEKTKKVFNDALRGIQFETARADIKAVSFPILDNIVTIMKENPGYMLEIIGHTDNVGSAQSNLDLSERRAYSVRMYLMSRGIDSARLTSIGKGLTDPIAPNSTPEGRALNRRVEFVVRQDSKVLLKSE